MSTRRCGLAYNVHSAGWILRHGVANFHLSSVPIRQANDTYLPAPQNTNYGDYEKFFDSDVRSQMALRRMLNRMKQVKQNVFGGIPLQTRQETR